MKRKGAFELILEALTLAVYLAVIVDTWSDGAVRRRIRAWLDERKVPAAVEEPVPDTSGIISEATRYTREAAAKLRGKRKG